MMKKILLIILAMLIIPMVYGECDNLTTDITISIDSEPYLEKKVVVNGNEFYFRKHPTNNNPANLFTLEVNDMIYDGWWDNTNYFGKAMYLGVDIDIKASWNDIDPIEDITLI